MLLPCCCSFLCKSSLILFELDIRSIAHISFKSFSSHKILDDN